jgi:hypothetical protein
MVGGRDPSSQPPEHAATICAVDTSNTPAPATRCTAAHPAPICATASATGCPAGTSRSMSVPQLALACRSNRANPTRIGSACAANRDNQPRTVEAGRPAAAQIRRHPQPVAQPSSADQITDTGSTRRPRQNRGNSTCERPHPPAPEQIPRRGRIRRTDSAPSRTNRGAVCPHGANRPPQAGQVSSPRTSCVSTRTGSGPTLTNGPPPGAFARPFPTACQRMREGPLAFKIMPSLASPVLTLTRPPTARHISLRVLTDSDGIHRPRRQPKRRLTSGHRDPQHLRPNVARISPHAGPSSSPPPATRSARQQSERSSAASGTRPHCPGLWPVSSRGHTTSGTISPTPTSTDG